MEGPVEGIGAWNQDQAMADTHQHKTHDVGGIDLTSDTALSVQNNGQSIQFHIDPAQFEQLQNAPGFVPVIINIQPMTNIHTFLGLNSRVYENGPKPANDNQPAIGLKAA